MPTVLTHRELLLPSPTEEPSSTPPLVWSTATLFGLEVHREVAGRVRYGLFSANYKELEAMLSYLEGTRPRLSFGGQLECAARISEPDGLYARAVPVLKHHHLPIEPRPRQDQSGFLLRLLGSSACRDHDVTLQLLFRSLGGWEHTFGSPLFENVAARQPHRVRAWMDARHGRGAYHVELRTRIAGPSAEDVLASLGLWLEQWTLADGSPWRRWKVVPKRKEWRFQRAMADHVITRFSSKRGRRDVSEQELAHLLSIPWAGHHPECSYSGAPRGRPGPEVLVPLSVSRDPPSKTRLMLGLCGYQQVALPRAWNHGVLLGRTQTGKSTLALNLALQILRKQPDSSVIVIEPTGTLVDEIVSRLPGEIAAESIEIDPAHANFDLNGAKMVSVPLSLLHAPEKASESFERWAEALAGDLLTAIRSAWGEESIGGRAELVLRALVQGLARSPGSNLVDAYQILTSKPALQRFVKTAPPGPLRDFLEHHLPRLDYNFTMSTLDKVGKIATNPLLRVALCQRIHAVSFDQLLGHRLLLLNLSKAALGADGANFLGAVYLTQLWAAIQRSGRPDKPVYLVLDEVHNYAIPTLADMLSEGAKYGLHVIAVTQYLHRVPPRIQAALLGNVDVWLLFSLGVEDMDDAWKIVHGEQHGWLPHDLVDGLRPHEVAMATSGSLVKLETRPSPAPASNGADLKGAVVASSRRYAQPEDSEASPWLVDQDDVEALLKALSYRSRTPDELEGLTSLRADKIAAALRRSEEAGEIERDSEDPSRVHLTPRGSVHLCALEGRRNEGEDHVETLVDLVMWLGSKHVPVTIPEQVAGVLMPDGQFRYGDAVYNVEVECSTVAKAAEQVVRNVRKAREAGNRVLVALPDGSGVQRLLSVLDSAFPGLRLWPDGVGVVWRDEKGTFQPHRVPGTEVWSFLEQGVVPEVPPGEHRLSETFPEVTETDPLLGLVRSAIHDLVASGKKEATSREILDALAPSERLTRTEHQVAIVLSALGLVRRRVRIGEERPRVYDLSTLDSNGRTDRSASGSGPTAWTNSGTDSGPGKPGSRDRSNDSTSSGDPGGPAGPDGPDD